MKNMMIIAMSACVLFATGTAAFARCNGNVQGYRGMHHVHKHHRMHQHNYRNQRNWRR